MIDYEDDDDECYECGGERGEMTSELEQYLSPEELQRLQRSYNDFITGNDVRLKDTLDYFAGLLAAARRELAESEAQIRADQCDKLADDSYWDGDALQPVSFLRNHARSLRKRPLPSPPPDTQEKP